ncbi:ABA4-like family protein [Streptomyces sp. NPDC048604]|uniref:ABA4-like family protein n=1 Tax=Streptomyces sp. NPDC048604 TaxID=3365578 RepID=UPI00371CB42C
MTAFLFDLSFWLAAPVWLLMIFAPSWDVTTRIASSPLTVLPILGVWLALAMPVAPELWAAVTSPDLDVFRDLAATSNGAGAVWAQVIAWDLLIGQWMFLQARKSGVPTWVMAPLLILTILLSPVGLPLFLAIRATAQRRAATRVA